VLGGRFGEQSDDTSRRLLDDHVAAGGRFVETASAYADGAAERALGAALRTLPDDVLCVTKVGHPRAGRTDVEHARIPAEIDQSRRRLGRDVLDLVLLHRDAPGVEVEVLLGPLLNAAHKGDVAAIGVANWSAERLVQALSLAASAGVPLAAASAHLSLATCVRPLWPGVVAADTALLAVHARQELPLLAWSANARGWFSGRLLDPAHPDADARRAFDTPRNRRRLRHCRYLANALGTTPTCVALAWTLRRHPFAAAVVGPATPDELRDAIAAASLTLPDDAISALDAL